MKKKFIYSLLLVLIMPLCLIFGGCGDDHKPLATIDGCEIQSVAVFHVHGGYYNVEIGVQNTTSETKTFDFSKVIFKINNEIIIEHAGDPTEYTANKYRKWSFTVSNNEDLNVGDSVSVYYEDQFLATITIKDF